jgi:hypothetical protein
VAGFPGDWVAVVVAVLGVTSVTPRVVELVPTKTTPPDPEPVGKI